MMKTKFLLAALFFYSTGFCQGKFFGGNADGFGTSSVTNIILPVKVVSFTVSENDKTIRSFLTLSSPDAICSIYFERSNDAITFASVDSLEALNPGLNGINFQFRDLSPLYGIKFYRIKIISCDGNIMFTHIVSVSSVIRKNRLYYSMPEQKINYTVTENGKIKIYNSVGQLMYQLNISIGTGSFLLPGLHRGIYLIRFLSEPSYKIFIE